MHNCPICYRPVRHPQQVTCGGRDCRDAWRHMNSDARFKRQNLASLTQSERAYALTQGPSSEELEAQAEQQALLDSEVAQYQEQQKKKEVPQFLRSMLDPANAPIKE